MTGTTTIGLCWLHRLRLALWPWGLTVRQDTTDEMTVTVMARPLRNGDILVLCVGAADANGVKWKAPHA